MTLAELRDAGEARLDRGLGRFLVDLFGYALVSIAALACDCGLLWVFVLSGAHYLVASFLSFSAGMVVAYMLSVRFVFADRRSGSRKAEVTGFVLVGVAGLALTQAMMFALVSAMGLAVVVAKVITLGVVFVFNFLGRRQFVFSGSGAG